MGPTPDSEEPEIKELLSPTEKESGQEPAAVTTSKPSTKRRTKTGCLTCRKRRIKCGEEKPFCKNCIKSKRDCAGYVQPLVYKQHNHGPHAAGHDALDTSSFSEQEQFHFNARIDVNIPQPGVFNPFAYPGYHDEHHTRHGSLPSSQGYHYPPPDAGPYVLQSSVPLADAYRRHSMHQVPSQYPYGHGVAQVSSNMQRGDQPWSARSEQSSNSDSTSFPYAEPASNLTSPYEVYPQSHGVAPGYFPYDAAPLHETHPRRYSVHGFVQASPFGATVPTLPNPQITPPSKADEEVQHDDDYDEIEMEESVDPNEPGQEREQQFTELLGRYSKYYKHNTRQRPQVERPDALQTAQHPITVSPLQDERSERIFCHFVEVTGRCMTIFERSPVDSWSLPPRTLWTYTLPSAAMSQPALAHAILALGGLHIAKLQHSSEDPPLKHFTYALRRVGNLLSLPKRRHEITTLATVLLLGFYEVLAADHSRWNLHLTGATKLVLEHDYATMTRNVRRMRNYAKESISRFSRSAILTQENYLAVAGIPETLLDDEDWEVDQHIVSTLIGQDVDYDGQVHPNFAEPKERPNLSEKDVADLKTKMDLRWWYCKQDVFQSMISGDPLLMDYAQWKYCPPRGRIGNAGMPYATFDHLLLLLARLTDFGGKDRSRKQRVVASQGGQWRPPPGFFPVEPPPAHVSQHVPTLPSQPVSNFTASYAAASSSTTQPDEKVKSSPAPSANEGRIRQSKPGPPITLPQQVGPPFNGMMPPPPLPPKMSASFHTMNEQLRSKPSMTPDQNVGEGASKEADLDAETEQALAEHAAMKNAFDVFVQSLGPDFEPLVNDGSFLQTSPFGAPILYRSPAIAAIWLHYYVGRVLLYRLHPQMPPAAMVSASVTVHLTRDYAQTAGKVAAGLYAMTPGAPGDPLDPTLAGALIESTFPLLFAAVQYQDASQRGWTISKLHDIARMTGWQTSGAVAAACEIAWERMGLAGKGPPYTRSLDRNNKDARVNGTSRRVDPAKAEGYSGPHDVDAEQESQFLSHDRSLIDKHGSTRVHWALGLLSVEEDIKKLDIGK